jgi:hypothetical protein
VNIGRMTIEEKNVKVRKGSVMAGPTTKFKPLFD